MSYRALVASTAATVAFFSALSAALACTPGTAGFDDVYPPDGATISPMGSFSLEFIDGEIQEVTLVDEDGDDVEVERTRSYSKSSYGTVAVYRPVEPLDEGATYTLSATHGGIQTVGPQSSSQKSLEASYTVESPEETAAPPKPEYLELYTVHRPNRPATCDPGAHVTEIWFDYDKEARSKAGYFVVTLRENEADGEGESETHLYEIYSRDGPIKLHPRLSFEPQCVTVEVHAPDRTSVSTASTCTREVCADATTNAALPEGDEWTEMPSCEESQASSTMDDDEEDEPSPVDEDSKTDDSSSSDRATPPAGGGCGGCRQTNGGAPGSLPVLLVAVLGLVGVRRIV